jgi:CheY-like chemotaxis protein
MNSNAKSLNVLLADDDPADHSKFYSALSASVAPVKINSVYNGMKLIDYLQITGSDKNASATLPDLIITDLYMPFAGGLQVLKQIKTHHLFRHIPIYVFSSNYDNTVRTKVLQNGATRFNGNDCSRQRTEAIRVADTVSSIPRTGAQHNFESEKMVHLTHGLPIAELKQRGLIDETHRRPPCNHHMA